MSNAISPMIKIMNNFCDLGDFELIFFFDDSRVKKEKNVGFTFSVYALPIVQKKEIKLF